MHVRDASAHERELYLLAAATVVAFSVHNALQECIMRLPNFRFGAALGFLEVVGVTACSFVEFWSKKHSTLNTYRRIRSLDCTKAFLAAVACLFVSSAASNAALNFINYPTKVIFRSCKLVPTMLFAKLLAARNGGPEIHYGRSEYAAALAICLGLVAFGMTDAELYPHFSAVGVCLVSVSVLADAMLPNLQRLCFDAGLERIESLFASNIAVLSVMVVVFGASGDLRGTLGVASESVPVFTLLLAYTLASYVAVSLYIALVQRHGSVVAVLVGNARKVLTIVLSFLLFPKPFSVHYVTGTVLTMGGLTAAMRAQSRKAAAAAAAAAALPPLPTATDLGFSDQQKVHLLSHEDAGSPRSPLSPGSPTRSGGRPPLSKSRSRGSMNQRANGHHHAVGVGV